MIAHIATLNTGHCARCKFHDQSRYTFGQRPCSLDDQEFFDSLDITNSLEIFCGCFSVADETDPTEFLSPSFKEAGECLQRLADKIMPPTKEQA